MTTVTINGHLYSDDSDPSTGMGNGGHLLRFFPLLQDVVAVAAQAASNAATAAAAAASAVTGASTSATSTTSLALGLGAKSLTIQAGKNIVIGMTVKIAVTADGTKWMAGDVTAYNSGTGALDVNVTHVQGSGTYAAWTVSLSGPIGPGLPAASANTGKFAYSDGTSWIGSAALIEAGGRIGIGRTPTTYKLEVEDSKDGICGLNQINNHAGAAAESRQAATSNAGATYLRQVSTAAGGWGGLFITGSGGGYVRTEGADPLRLGANNQDWLTIDENGIVNFHYGSGGQRLNGHITYKKFADITPVLNQAVYTTIAFTGLGVTRVPDLIWAKARVTSTVNGLAVGDEVDVSNIRFGANGTGIVMRQVATPQYSYGAGLSANVSSASMVLVVRAEWK